MDLLTDHLVSRKSMYVPFSMALGNVKLMRKYFPKHLGMETARDKDTVSCEFSLTALVLAERREEVLFNMASGNVEFMHERFPKHFRIGTARIK